MCLFPYRNTAIKSKSYEKGLHEFDCGACPECLAKRSRLWVLRCSAEARTRKACMITLTYDTYIRDEAGNIIGENLSDNPLSKEDAQKFLKRLRSYYDNLVMSKIRKIIKKHIKHAYHHSPVAKYHKNYRDFRKNYIMFVYKDEIEEYIKEEFEKNRIKISYLLTAEHGKRTNRPHYHAIIFGIDFAEDRAVYKKSKRGNLIYTSNTLTKIWNNGICTVDCVNISSKVARYCTKYCAKDARADDTFMLVSRGIGDEELLRTFNGKSYIIDGREYPIPKLIWNKVIMIRYEQMHYKYNYYGSIETIYPSYNYKAYDYDKVWESDINRLQRHYFQALRDSDKQYQSYLAYWSNRFEVYNKVRGDFFTRLSMLPNEKYYSYKQACYKCYNMRRQKVTPIAPRANQKERYEREFYKAYGISFTENGLWVHRDKNICPYPSRHTRANDTKKPRYGYNVKVHAFRNDFGEAELVYLRPAPNVISPFE